MSNSKILILGLAAVLAGCNPFHRTPAVEVSSAVVNLNTRWHGTLASPAQLAGVVQMSGSATMTPGGDAGVTHVTLDLTNATPGGVHPWEVRYGQCNSDEGLFGAPSVYGPIKVGNDGRAHASANVELHTPTSGRYFVQVTASAANSGTIIACGNLAPPSN